MWSPFALEEDEFLAACTRCSGCIDACPHDVIFALGAALEGPALAWVQIDAEACLPYLGPECSACQGSCPVPGALTFTAEKPIIDAQHCVGCGLCREACVVDPKAIAIRPLVQQ